MSRFNAQAQKGYYKTPAHLLPVISSYLSCSDPENTRIIDPCAGDGEAIEHIGLSLGFSRSRIYANELDEPRALACEKRGLVSLCGDAVYELQAPAAGFQLVFLNPPYDQEADGTGRTERKFLATTRFLQQEGILVYVVPLFVLQIKNVFERLARSCHNIGVMRFPDGDYATYKQCVLIACNGRGDVEQEKERLNALVENPPVLGEHSAKPWIVPAPRLRIEPFPYYSQHLTARQINNMLAGPVARSECLFGLVQRSERPARCLMPLRSGHQAVMLASGVMDGVFKDKLGHLLIVAGRTEIRVTKSVESGEGNSVMTTIRKTPQAVVKALDMTASLEAGELVVYEMR